MRRKFGKAPSVFAEPKSISLELSSAYLPLVTRPATEWLVDCIVEGFLDGGCSLAGAANCVCTNTTLRAHMSRCVQTSCVYADQLGALKNSPPSDEEKFLKHY
ncbi:integral membrane protein [Colletotrichum tofieldiae]|uniref:Integral membrane protein n=1 Tax=Colletotrichum tofieldiae TaxID=708197 RepID=A0A166SVM5_9PEZI|nr:integral membrane protein [Colletotrichum tofieldiae]